MSLIEKWLKSPNTTRSIVDGSEIIWVRVDDVKQDLRKTIDELESPYLNERIWNSCKDSLKQKILGKEVKGK